MRLGAEGGVRAWIQPSWDQPTPGSVVNLDGGGHQLYQEACEDLPPPRREHLAMFLRNRGPTDLPSVRHGLYGNSGALSASGPVPWWDSEPWHPKPATPGGRQVGAASRHATCLCCGEVTRDRSKQPPRPWGRSGSGTPAPEGGGGVPDAPLPPFAWEKNPGGELTTPTILASGRATGDRHRSMGSHTTPFLHTTPPRSNPKGGGRRHVADGAHEVAQRLEKHPFVLAPSRGPGGEG